MTIADMERQDTARFEPGEIQVQGLAGQEVDRNRIRAEGVEHDEVEPLTAGAGQR